MASTGVPALFEALTLPKAEGEAAIVEKLKGIVASPPDRNPAKGDVFAERYRLVRELGRGGMGVVWEGEDVELGRRVAIKMITGRVDSSGLARMRREARAVAKLAHPNVAAVYDVDVDSDPAYIVMEFVDGGDLGSWLRREPRPSWRAVLSAFEQAGLGLDAAHRAGLVHRDFKPANVILGGGRVRVVDFGLARAGARQETAPPEALLDVQDPTLTAHGVGLGTPAYMAPEQHEDGAVTPAADVFAFACSLYEGLYGERPYSGRTIVGLFEAKRDGPPAGPPRTDAAAAVPARLFPVLAKGLAADPDARWSSMRAFVQALRRASRTNRSAGVVVSAAVVGCAAFLAWTRPTPPVEAPADVAECLAQIDEFAQGWRNDEIQLVGTLYADDAGQAARDSVRQRIEDFGRRWASVAREACARGDLEIGDTMFACLTDVGEAARTAMRAARSSAQSARRFPEKLETLRQPNECGETVLHGLQPLPKDEGQRRELEEILAWTRDAENALEGEELERRLERLAELGHKPTTAAVELEVAWWATDEGDPKRTLEFCDRAFASATEGGAEWSALRAASSCAMANANIADLEQAKLWDGRHEALSLRLGLAKAEHVSRRTHLALALARAGELEDAMRLGAEVEAEVDKLPRHYATYQSSLLQLGQIAIWADDFDVAVARLEAAYDANRRYHADDIDFTVGVAGTLATAYRAQKRFGEAEAMFERSLRLPATGTATLMLRLNYSLMLSDLPSRTDDGLAVLAPALAELDRRKRLGTLEHAHILTATGQLQLRGGRLPEAREALTAAKSIYAEHLPPGHIRLQLVDERLTELVAAESTSK